MPGLNQLRDELVRDGKITADEVEVIRGQIESDGQLDLDDVKFLVQLASEVKQVCPEFDAIFFPALKQVILADGRVGLDEQFYLLKMLYSDGVIRPSEKQFLTELSNEVEVMTPELEALIETAMTSAATGWDVGGVTRS